MNQQFVPLESVSQLSQGKVYEEFMEKLARVQDEYIKHLRKHGVRAAAQKAKISLTVEFSTDVESVSAMIEDGELGSIDIACSIKVGPLDPPPYTSIASVDRGEDGRDVLFVQQGGSKKDSPRQQVLCADDGRPVNLQTGEILDGAAA